MVEVVTKSISALARLQPIEIVAVLLAVAVVVRSLRRPPPGRMR
jgi:hypothetical protein